jgi:hypothetical protein
MAYVISEGLYEKIKVLIEAAGMTVPMPEQSRASTKQPSPPLVMFSLDEPLYTGQSASATVGRPKWGYEGGNMWYDFLPVGSSDTKIYDVFMLCDGVLPVDTNIMAAYIGDAWCFIRSTQGCSGGTLLGKTSAAWTKGTSQDITVYSGAKGSEAILNRKDSSGVDQPVTVDCYNRFADVAADKWVRITPGGDLIAAECG